MEQEFKLAANDKLVSYDGHITDYLEKLHQEAKGRQGQGAAAVAAHGQDQGGRVRQDPLLQEPLSASPSLSSSRPLP
ncbi:hypothetical protein L7F22_055116 [Adiantum nelumboides]|nr:hypothetical protein [Adiantum nelumboides]